MPDLKSPERGQILIPLIILVLLTGSIMFVGGFNKVKSPEPATSSSNLTVAPETPDQSRNNLQHKTFSFVTPSPTAGACVSDNGVCNDVGSKTCCRNYFINCVNNKCVGIGPNNEYSCESAGYFAGETTPAADKWCDQICGGKKGFTCVAKPIVYLYPKFKTYVDVSVETSGKIVVSNPTYPQGGWKNVEADPSGNLVYQGKNYKELFYESEVGKIRQPENGIIIPVSQLENKLKEILFELGLNNSESQEFLDFWVPRLEDLNSNYILFSTVPKEIKEQKDKLIINPEPDTRIEFIAYFKPLDFPSTIEPLVIPQRPNRIGFTSVEWGGTIDKESQDFIIK